MREEVSGLWGKRGGRLGQWGEFFLVILAVLSIAGCASWFMAGGQLVGKGYQPPKVLVTYRAEGNIPAGAQYLLVETNSGEAMFERGADGSGTLFLTHWKDDNGDHYAGWVKTGPAYEFVVPQDRTKMALRYVYPAGYYSTQDVNGISRPVPTTTMEAVSKLYPTK